MWVCAPPSDHEVKVEEPCGDGADTELVEPWMTVRVNGVVPDDEPTASWSPDGAEAKVSSTVFGSSRRVTAWVRPSASVATSFSSRYDGYSWSGATNEPAATPVQLRMPCAWQVSGVEQWCI